MSQLKDEKLKIKLKQKEYTDLLDGYAEEEISRVKLMNEVRKLKQKANIEAPVNDKEELILKLEK